jgi:hypothetical protein
MVRFKNFECTINVEGHPLPEYTDPDDAGDREGPVPTAIVYVHSEEEKAFSICLDILDDVGLFPRGKANRVLIKLALDDTTSPSYWRARPHSHCFVDGDYFYDTNGQYVKGQFLFSKLDVLEETRDPQNSGEVNSLGEITVSLYRFKVGKKKIKNREKGTNEPLSNIKSVTEKDLKGRDITQSVRWALCISMSFPHIITFDLQIFYPKTRCTASNF